MKKVLFAGLLTLAGVCANAQNLIQNGKFENEVTTVVTSPNKATASEWFLLNREPDNATELKWEKTGDAQYANAIMIDNSNAQKNIPWYRAFLGQRLTNGFEKGVYMLTFYVKAKEANASTGVYIRQTNDEKNDEGKSIAKFFMRKDYNPESHQTTSGARHDFVVKKAGVWNKVVVYFDTNKIVNSINSAKSDPNLKVDDTNDSEILKDCFIAFVSPNKGAVIEIADVSLEKK